MRMGELWRNIRKWLKEDRGNVLYLAFLMIIAVVILRDNRIKSEELNKIIGEEKNRVEEVKQIKEQLSTNLNNFQCKENNNSQVLGETKTVSPTPSIEIGMIEIKAESGSVNIYESAATGTLVLETKTANEILFFRKKENNWYQVDLENNKVGWIQAELVNEIKS